MYSITAAGVVHAVTKSCSRGVLADCSCDMVKQSSRKEKTWKWGGCSDDIKYGLWFSRTFVDAPEYRARSRKRSGRYLMNLHNNEAGRQVSQHINPHFPLHHLTSDRSQNNRKRHAQIHALSTTVQNKFRQEEREISQSLITRL